MFGHSLLLKLLQEVNRPMRSSNYRWHWSLIAFTSKTSKVFSTNLTTSQPHIQSNKDLFKRSNFQTTPQQSLRLDCKTQIVGLQQFVFSKKIFAMIQISLDHPIKLFLTIHPPKNGPSKTHPKFKKTFRIFWMFFLGSLICLGGSINFGDPG